MQKNEMPPEHLWADPEGLEQWWQYIEEKRSDGRSDSDDQGRFGGRSDDDSDADQEPGMAENELARFLKQG